MKSVSPYGHDYLVPTDQASEDRRLAEQVACAKKDDLQIVVVMGLGFVGTAVAAAVASSQKSDGTPRYLVIGVDRGDARNYWKIARVLAGQPPVQSSDARLEEAYRKAGASGSLTATWSQNIFNLADFVIVDIHLDVHKSTGGTGYHFDDTPFLKSMAHLANHIQEHTLVVLETTVPPGTTSLKILPIFENAYRQKGWPVEHIRLGHAPERVMPGQNYLESITSFHRVYSGVNETSLKLTRGFLSSFINVKEFPLVELHSPTASEMCKVLENSYRALNIAFIQEWAEYAESAGVNLPQIVEAIRIRPTHKNIMMPGFGVGGYCLTKDALLADHGYSIASNGEGHLPVSMEALRINDHMPTHSYNLLRKNLGDLAGKKILILGVSYLPAVADTRFSPTEFLLNLLLSHGASVKVHDPIVKYWDEKNAAVEKNLSTLFEESYDAVVLAVRHQEYLQLTSDQWLNLLGPCKFILDGFNIIEDSKAKSLHEKGIVLAGIGKGHWNTYPKKS